MLKKLFSIGKKQKPYKPLEGTRLVLKDHPKNEEDSREFGAKYTALSNQSDCNSLTDYAAAENALNSSERTIEKTKETIKSFAEKTNLLKAEGIKKGKLVEFQEKLKVITNKVELKKMALVKLMGHDPTTISGTDEDKYNKIIYEAHKFSVVILFIYIIVYFISVAVEFITAKGPLSRVYGEYGIAAVFLGLGIAVGLTYLIKEPMEGLLVRPYVTNSKFRKSMNSIFIAAGVVMLFFAFYSGGEYSNVRDGALAQDHATEQIVNDRTSSITSTRNLIQGGGSEQEAEQLVKAQKEREKKLVGAISKGSETLEEMQARTFANKGMSKSFMVIILALMLVSGTSFAFISIISKILLLRSAIERSENKRAKYAGEIKRIGFEISKLKKLRKKEKAIEPDRLKSRNDRDTKFAKYQYDLTKAMYPDATWEHDKAAIKETKLKKDFPDAFK